MAYETILYDLKDDIATITFNRPKALNALNSVLLGELGDLLTHIENESTPRVLILTGTGSKAFVAGADITELARFNPLAAKQFSQWGHSVLMRLQDLAIPVIAAVNGFALGGGCELALACDFIYAAQNARFGLPEITLGIIPGFGGTQRLPRLVGANLAREMIFTGKMLSAEESLAAGLVNRVCPPEDLMTETLQTAGMIAGKGRIALRAAKRAVNQGENVDLSSGCRMETDAFALCFASADAREGTTAFLEKRSPTFISDWTQ